MWYYIQNDVFSFCVIDRYTLHFQIDVSDFVYNFVA
jgi:hypothetical protein